MYKDERKKRDVYRDDIMSQIAQTGVYPSLTLVDSQLDDIDFKLSMFAWRVKSHASRFDPDTYNKEYETLWRDLKILYECVNELAVKEYAALRKYIESELDVLEAAAIDNFNKAELETTSTFGKTLFYLGNGFNQQYKNGTITVDVGDIKTRRGSRIAAVFTSTDVDLANVSFTIGDKKIAPYNYAGEYYKVPGGPVPKEFDGTVSTASKRGTYVAVTTDNKIDGSKEYSVLNGLNRVRFTGESYKVSYPDIKSAEAIRFDEAGEYSFYIFNGSKAVFSFTDDPVKTSFNSREITIKDKICRVSFSLRPGTAWTVSTDGNVYAVKPGTAIKSDTLFCEYSDESLKEYKIIETGRGEEITLSVSCMISNADKPYYDITGIALKESLTI